MLLALAASSPSSAKTLIIEDSDPTLVSDPPNVCSSEEGCDANNNWPVDLDADPPTFVLSTLQVYREEPARKQQDGLSLSSEQLLGHLSVLW